MGLWSGHGAAAAAALPRGPAEEQGQRPGRPLPTTNPKLAPAPHSHSFNKSLLRACWEHSCEQGFLVGMAEEWQRLGNRLPHVGRWPALGTLPWGQWGQVGC